MPNPFDFSSQMGGPSLPSGGFTMPPPQKRGGMFANADWGSAISAALNGYLAAGGNPAGVQGLQQLHQRKMMEQEQAIRDQEYQHQRQDRLSDAQTLYNMRLNNPIPTQTDRYIAELEDPNTSPSRKAILKQLIMKPIGVETYGADGSREMKFYYPDSLGGAPGAGPDTGGDDDWEYDNGGPTPQASGGFPGSY